MQNVGTTHFTGCKIKEKNNKRQQLFITASKGDTLILFRVSSFADAVD
jgi:hypothetical protein